MKALSHVYVANAVINDARANGGKVKVGNALYDVRPEYKSVLMNEAHAPFIRAGAVGPDAFPSLLTGQTQAHAFTDKWLAYIDHKLHVPSPSAAQEPLNAFFAGFLSHVCADMWTHDWVNHYAGGPWPELSKLATPAGTRNVITHLAIEGIMDENVSRVKSSMKRDIKAPVPELVGLLVNTKRVPVLADNEILGKQDIACCDFLDDDFARRYWFTQQYLGASSGNPVSKYLKAWHGDLKSGLEEMVIAHEKAISRHLTKDEDMFGALQDEWAKWAKRNVLSMYGGPDVLVKLPVDILNFLDIKVPFIDELKKKIKDNIKDYICTKAFGMTCDELKKQVSAQGLQAILKDPAVHAKVVAECGNIPNVSQLSAASNPIVWNSVTFTKIALMPVEEQRRLAKACGETLPADQPPVPFSVMCIDGSGQFKHGAAWPLTKGLLDKGIISHFDPARVRNQAPLPSDGRKLSSVAGRIKCASVKVTTADKMFAGTDADIQFGLAFKNGTTKEWVLDHKYYNDLERGDSDWYHFFTGLPPNRVDEIAGVSLRMVNTKGSSPDWNCKQIRVSINGGPSQDFAVNTEFKKAGNKWTKAASFKP